MLDVAERLWLAELSTWENRAAWVGPPVPAPPKVGA